MQQPTWEQDPEARASGGPPRVRRPRLSFAERCSLVPIPLVLVLFAWLLTDGRERTFESFSLLLVLNTLFLSFLPLLVSYFSLRGYMVSGHWSLLMLGNGTLSLGLGSFLAGLTPMLGGSPNTIVTVHNTAALLSGLFHVVGSAWALSGPGDQSDPKTRRLYAILSCSTVSLFLVLLAVGAIKGLTPVFFVQGEGATNLRQLILGTSIACFGVAAVLLASVFTISKSRFLNWYWTALALVTIGLLCVFVQKSVGSDIGWLGRFAQYLAGGYFLVAVVVAWKDVGQRQISLVSGIWTFLYHELEILVEQRTRELTETNQLLSFEIAERKETEERLRQSEENYRRLHESMMDAFVRVDMTGRILETNHAYQAMLGYSEQELCNLTHFDLTPERWHAFEARIVEEQIQPKGYSDVYQKEYRKKDGTIFPVELRTFLLRDEGGKPSGMWAIVHDITDRTMAEIALAQSKEELRLSLDATTEGIWKWNFKTNVLEFSPKYYTMLGYEPDEFPATYENWVTLIHPEDRSRALLVAEQYLEAKQDIYSDCQK